MKKRLLFSKIAGILVVSAMIGTTALPAELQAAGSAKAASEEVTGSVPELKTEKVPEATGTVYHVDSNAKDESGDGTEEKPFKTLEQVNQVTLQPGDGISLKCGSVFDNQQLAPKGSGTEDQPIVINTYGNKEDGRPKINAGGLKKTGGDTLEGTATYSGYKEAVLIQNMEHVYVTGLEVTNDDDFTTNWRSPNRGENVDLEYPRRLGIHVTIDSRAEGYKTEAGNEESRVYKGIVIDDCYIHDVDGNEERKVNKVDGGIGVEVISDSRAGLFPYFDGITLQNNRIDKVDRTGIKLARISDLKNFYSVRNDFEDPNCDVDYNGDNDNSRYSGVRNHDQASRNIKVVGNYVSSVGGDGILICESQGALVEHNILDGNASRVSSGNANAGIWQWNAFDTTFRYNESFHGPDYNQDGCSFDSDYWSAGTIFEYNYSHDVPMGFMLLMGGNDTDIIRYNLSQNDGVAWRHGAGGASTPSYIYNNVFYYDGAKWLFNHSNNGGVALGNNRNWEFYNNIYYNYNPDSVSKWTSKAGYQVTEKDWSNTKLGGNLVYEAGGKHDPGEIPGAIQAGGDDQIFLNPGKAEGAKEGIGTTKPDTKWSTNWESLKAYGLTADSPARNAGVYVDVKPQATSGNQGHWDSDRDRNATGDFFGNALYNGAPDIGIIEMSNEGSETEYPLESNAIYGLRGQNGNYLTAEGENASMSAEGSQFVLENVKDNEYKVRIWNVDASAYYYLTVDGDAVKFTTDDSAVWKLTDLHNGLYKLTMDGKALSCDQDGNLSAVAAKKKAADTTSWYFDKKAQSKSYNAGGEEIPGFSADRKFDEKKKLSGYATEDMKTLNGQGEGVYATGVTKDSIEYKLYAANEANNVKLYVSEMENVKGRTFDVLVNGSAAIERYTLKGDTDVIELADVYPVNGVITVKLQSAYSEEADAMTNPILNGITADSAPMGEVKMRMDAGNSDETHMENHDGLYADTAFVEDGKSGYYEIDGKTTTTVNAGLQGNKPVPDGGMGTALKSGRAGENFGYKFKVSPGQYRVKLYFNDTSEDAFTPDPFQVTVNGKKVKENFDITKEAGGQNKAVDITVPTTAKGGMIDIQFKAAAGKKALVNAVVVEPYKALEKENLVSQENISADAKEADSMAVTYAADNNQSTRWSSGQGTGHWIAADFGKKYMVDTVMLDWTPGSYATSYRIEAAVGDGEWTTVKTVSDAYPGLNVVEFEPVEATKIRVVAETYLNQWGMSMTEFGVYGEEIKGEAAATTSVEKAEGNTYNVKVDLEHVYQKYRNIMLSFRYDPKKMTMKEEAAALNEKALLNTGKSTVTDNDDGTRTTTFTYGIKDQAAFKDSAHAMTGAFDVKENAARSEVKVDVTFSNAEGHTTALEQAKAYVPNIFTYDELTDLIKEADKLLENAKPGEIPGTWPQEAIDTFKVAVDAAKAVGDGQESAVYEKAYMALEDAINVFKESENDPLYQSYHKDFNNPGETAPKTSAGTSSVSNGAWNLELGANTVAKITDATPLNSGYYYVRLKVNNTDDQTLFSVVSEDGTRRIRTGWEASHWFYDGSLAGWGEWGTGDNISANQEFEVMMKFDSSKGNTTPATLWVNGKKVNDKNLSYASGAGFPTLESRRNGKTFSVEELYFTNAEPVTINVSATGDGSVSQTGAVTSFVEANKTFYFTPEAGKNVKSVKVDGQEVEWNKENNSYTFEYLTENHTLEVTFDGEVAPPEEKVTYHQDYMVDTEANFAGDRTTTAVEDQSLKLKAEGWGDKAHDNNPAIAIDQNAPELTSGTFYTRFRVNSEGIVDGATIGKDQILFDIKTNGTNFIRIGFDYVGENSKTGNWFFDKAKNGQGWGNFSKGAGVPILTENEDHTLKLRFENTAKDMYNLYLTVDGQDMGKAENVKYEDTAGKYGIGARRTTKNYIVKESYYTNNEEYKIQVTAGEGGSVSQTGDVTVFGNSNKTLFVTPNEGYEIDTVTVNGESAELTNGQYTFMNIAGDQTFAVTFKKVQTVNKDELQKVYDQYKNVENTGYTEESWKAFETALKEAEAVLKNEKADQKAVDAAKAALETAYKNLVLETPDKTNLQAMYDEWKDKEQGEYTEDSWNALQAALTKAAEVLNKENATAEEVREAETALSEAINNLETNPEPGVDKTALQKLFNENMNRTETDYTQETWAVFKAALDNADKVLKDENATQDAVNEAYNTLKAAVEQLQERPEEPSKVDKDGLKALVEEALGKNAADYTAESWKGFEAALKNANAVLADENATQEQVNQAKVELETAMNGLVKVDSGNGGQPGGETPSNPGGTPGNSGGKGSSADKAAKTGDTAPLAGVATLLLGSGAAILAFRRKK